MKKKLLIHTTAWGKYRDFYNTYTKPSLEKDVAYLKSQGWEISYTQGAFNLDEAPEKFDTTRSFNKCSALLLAHLRKTIQDCIDQESYMFLAPPDTVFALGTLTHCVKIAHGKNVCVAIPHIRASLGDGKVWENKLPTGKELVRRCFTNGHDAFIKTMDNENENATWAGISTRKIDSDLHAMIHCMPTIYLAKFTPLDLRYWEYAMDFGNWDRQWLKILWNDSRVKIVGSSNMAFCVEVTDIDKNVPPLQSGLKNNDKYWCEDDFNKDMRNFVFSLEG